MLPDLNEIKQRRKLLGITQTGLAKSANVSQSLIAKIESGRLIPSYGNAKKLFDALDAMHKTERRCAGDIMQKRVITVRKNEKIKNVVSMMRRHGVSQLPVVDSGRVIGMISEKRIVEIGHDYSAKQESVAEMPVEKIMEDSIPLIQENTPQEIVAAMLEHYPALLVSRQGKIAGIITKTDLLGIIVGSRYKRAKY